MTDHLANPPFALNSATAVQRDRTPVTFRAPVPLKGLLERIQGSFVYKASGAFMALVRRIIGAILARVAKTFKVDLEANNHGASFAAAEDANPNAQAAVQDAASQATDEISQFARDLIARRPMLDRLEGEAGEAYLAMVLDELGQSMAATQKKLTALEEGVDKGVQAIATRLKVSPSSVRSLLEDGEIPKGSLLAGDPSAKALVEDMSRIQDLKTALVRMKISFCDHCVAATAEGSLPALARVAQEKTAEFGDESLEKAIKNALSQGVIHKNNDASLVSPLNLSDKSEIGNGEPPVDASAAIHRTPGRLSRAARYSADVSEEEPIRGSEQRESGCREKG